MIDHETLELDRHYAAEQELSARIRELETDLTKWREHARTWEARCKAKETHHD